MLFLSFQTSPSPNHWSVGLKTFFFVISKVELPRKEKKIIEKLQNKILSFLVLFTKLWDSGKSAALGLDKKQVKFSNVLIISFKNHYRSEFFNTFACQTDGRTDRLKSYIYRFFFDGMVLLFLSSN
jgi:hypothetical protein